MPEACRGSHSWTPAKQVMEQQIRTHSQGRVHLPHVIQPKVHPECELEGPALPKHSLGPGQGQEILRWTCLLLPQPPMLPTAGCLPHPVPKPPLPPPSGKEPQL